MKTLFVLLLALTACGSKIDLPASASSASTAVMPIQTAATFKGSWHTTDGTTLVLQLTNYAADSMFTGNAESNGVTCAATFTATTLERTVDRLIVTCGSVQTAYTLTLEDSGLSVCTIADCWSLYE